MGSTFSLITPRHLHGTSHRSHQHHALRYGRSLLTAFLLPHLFPYGQVSTQHSDHDTSPSLTPSNDCPLYTGQNPNPSPWPTRPYLTQPACCSKRACSQAVPHPPLQRVLFLQSHQVYSCLRAFAVVAVARFSAFNRGLPPDRLKTHSLTSFCALLTAHVHSEAALDYLMSLYEITLSPSPSIPCPAIFLQCQTLLSSSHQNENYTRARTLPRSSPKEHMTSE